MSRELNRVRREIEELTFIRDNLTAHITKLKAHENYLLKEDNDYEPRYPSEWVLRSEVESRVRIYMDLHMRQYGNEGRTKLIEAAKISTPTLQNILQETEQGKKQRFVRLDIAGRLFDAMNMQHVIHTIEVFEGRPQDLMKLPKPPYSHFEEE